MYVIFFKRYSKFIDLIIRTCNVHRQQVNFELFLKFYNLLCLTISIWKIYKDKLEEELMALMSRIFSYLY